MTELKARDLQQLESHGISVAEAERQLDLLRDPPAPPELIRPCLLDDGIVALNVHEQTRLREHFSVAGGRVSKFVPASGAASRMFRTLLEAMELDLPPDRQELERSAQYGLTQQQANIILGKMALIQSGLRSPNGRPPAPKDS